MIYTLYRQKGGTMTSGNLTAGDVLALTRNGDGFGFGGVGGFILLFIFLLIY